MKHFCVKTNCIKSFPQNLARGNWATVFAAVAGLLLLADASTLKAATDTWVGNTSALFSGANWTGGNNPPSSGDSLVFGAAGTQGTSLTADQTAGISYAGMTFNSGAAAFTIGGANGITLTGNVANNSTSLETLNFPISATAVRTITMTTGGGNLTLGGNISGTGGGFTLAGTGTLTLSGSNTFTAGISLNGTGTLQLKAAANNTSSGISGVMPTQNMTVAQLPSGSTIQLRADSTIASGGVVSFDSGSTEFGVNSAGNRLGGTNNFDVNNISTGTGIILYFGPQSAVSASTGWQVGNAGATPTFNVTGGNGYSMELDGLFVGNNDSLVFNPTTANLIIAGGIQNASTGGITKNGAGTLTLNGVCNYTGSTTIGAGNLVIGGAGQLGSGSYAGSITNNGTLTYNSSAAQTLSGIISGTGGVNQNGSGTLTISGNNTFTGGITLNNTRTLQLQANAGNTTSGISTVMPGQNMTAAQLPAGSTIQLRADSSVASAGIVSFDNGATEFGLNATPLSSGTYNFDVNQVTTGSTATTLQFGPQNTLSSSTGWQIGGSPIGGTTTINVTGGAGYSLQFGGFWVGWNNSLVFNPTTANLTVGGIGNGSTGSVTKNGAGTLTFNGTCSYTGATTINAGTLALAASGSLPSASSVSIAAGATFDVSAQTTYALGSGATLIASGNASAATIKGGTTVTLGSRPVKLTYDGSHPALTLSAGTLQLNNNFFTVVVPGSPLTVGTYTLISTPGTIIGTPNPAPSFTGGNGIASGDGVTISVSAHNVVLTVTSGGPGAVSASHSTLSPALASLTANGTSTQLITVQARDASNNNEVSGGATVVFSVSGTGTISGTTDNGNGTYSATLTSTSAGSGTVTATLNGTAVGTSVGATNCVATYFSANAGDAVPGLTGTLTTNFTVGAASFATVYYPAQGLGPIYNNSSCANCHNYPVTGGSGTSMLKRFGLNSGGVFNPLTNLDGTLLHEAFINANCVETNPPSANVTTLRKTRMLFGAGLIEAIPASVIISNAALSNPDGIVGTVATVTDINGQQLVGRFGWKAQYASLLAFVADAANNELGRTSRIQPVGHAPDGNVSLYNTYNTLADPNDVTNSTGKADIDRDSDYIRLLGPAPTLPLTADAVAGQALFHQISCDECHTPALTTSASFTPVSDLAIETNTVITALSGKYVPLYSDLALHNMGSLADGIAQGAASTNQMMTAPLWGLRYKIPYLHDGRATNSLDAAIRFHAGDAAAAATRYINLPTVQQQQLVQFLNSL